MKSVENERERTAMKMQQLQLRKPYANILKCMYTTRLRGGPTRLEASPETQPTLIVVTPLIRTMTTFHPDKYKKPKKECQKEEDK
jgi:hypothetical protein